MDIKQPGASSFMDVDLYNRLINYVQKHANEHTETQTVCQFRY
jgi:hypothetical protein